jgi:hypothetical protein
MNINTTHRAYRFAQVCGRFDRLSVFQKPRQSTQLHHRDKPSPRKLMPTGNGGPERTPGTEPDKDHSGKDVKPGSAHNRVVQGNIFPEGRDFR